MGRLDVTAIRQRQIVEAAFKVFSENGFHNTTVADIAAELDLGHSTIYRYFPNKLEIASAVIEDVISQVAAVLVIEPPENITTLEQYREELTGIGNRLFDFLEANPNLHQFLFLEALQIDESITRKILEAMERFASFTQTYLENGIRQGFLKPDTHPYQAAYAINGMVIITAWRLCGTPAINGETKKAWSETIIGMMLDGMGA